MVIGREMSEEEEEKLQELVVVGTAIKVTFYFNTFVGSVERRRKMR